MSNKECPWRDWPMIYGWGLPTEAENPKPGGIWFEPDGPNGEGGPFNVGMSMATTGEPEWYVNLDDLEDAVRWLRTEETRSRGSVQ